MCAWVRMNIEVVSIGSLAYEGRLGLCEAFDGREACFSIAFALIIVSWRRSRTRRGYELRDILEALHCDFDDGWDDRSSLYCHDKVQTTLSPGRWL